jgi:hypothetical protein
MVYFTPIPSHIKVSPCKSEQLTMPPQSTDPPLPELTPDLSDLTQAQHMELSLTALVTSGIKPDGNPNLSIRKMAIQYELPQSTLND